MSPRSEPTILLVQREFIARADFTRGAGTSGVTVSRAARPASDDLAGHVESALALAGRPKGPVWLLTDDVFSQTVSLSARQMKHLDDDEVAQALAYEAQLLSGIEAAESVVAWKPMSNDGIENEYWITAMPRTERSRIDQAIRGAGGKLAGIVHPIGLPRPIADGVDSASAWKRVETWHELWAEVESATGGTTKVRVRRTDPTRRHRELRNDAAPTEMLVAGAQAPATDATVARLDDDNVLSRWLAGWSSVLAETAPPVPVLAPETRAIPVRTQIIAALSGAVLAIVACAAHYMTLRARADDRTRELAEVSKPAELKATTEQAIAGARKEVDALRASAADREARKPRGWTPGIPGRVLELLASDVPTGLTVDAFEIGWRSSAIRGLCIEPHLADRLGASLVGAFAIDGYAVSPSTKKLRVDGPGTGLYEYEIEIQPSGARWAAPASPSNE
jgi:hypothetical protein